MDNRSVLSLDLVVPREVEHRANRAVFHVGECGTFGRCQSTAAVVSLHLELRAAKAYLPESKPGIAPLHRH